MADFLWVEQYRPKTIQDCILPDQTKKTFLEFLKKKEIPNMLLSGTAGTGKTTVARALCEQLNADYIIINGSDEGRHIDTLRNKIKNFASTVSFNAESKHKVVIIDEADYMNAESVQPALRNFIETFFENCRFIMTCNYPYKFIEPLRSRMTQIDFKIVNGQRHKSAQSLMKILLMIIGLLGASTESPVPDGTSLIVKQVFNKVYDERRVETMAFTPPEYPKYFLD